MRESIKTETDEIMIQELSVVFGHAREDNKDTCTICLVNLTMIGGQYRNKYQLFQKNISEPIAYLRG